MPHPAQPAGYSTRLIRQYRDTGSIRGRRGRLANAFSRRYTSENAIPLMTMDALHGDADRHTVICLGRLRLSVAPCFRETVIYVRWPIPPKPATE